MFQGAILVALPAAASLLAVNLTMGLMTRAVPQFNMFVGFPIVLLLGLLIVLFTLPNVVPQLSLMVDNVFDVMGAQILGGA